MKYNCHKAPLIPIFLLLAFLIFCACASDSDDETDNSLEDAYYDDDDQDDDYIPTRSISLATMKDKIRGSWVGQMAGVTWGATTEFKYMGEIIPDNEVPAWEPDRINRGFLQDDVYVEIPFLQAMVDHGVNVGWEIFGEYFKAMNYPLAHANRAARRNLRQGISAPDSGHYSNNQHCDDIDWQIESDFVGTLCPGLVNPAIEIAWRAGHVINYGDGVLGGVFMAAMHAEAFFAKNRFEIIEAGRQALPPGTFYRHVVEDVIEGYEQGLDWQTVWLLLQEKWGMTDRCPSSANWPNPYHNIDAKLNGAYVLIGLLWGDGDFEKSMRIAMRCGQDSDCNPSSVGSILGNWYGYSLIPDRFKKELDENRQFIFTDYTFKQAVEINLALARRLLARNGANVLNQGANESWMIPMDEEISPPIIEQWPFVENEPPTLTVNLVSQDGRRISVEASAEDDDGILEYEWYFGDFHRTKTNPAEHTYIETGQYEIIVYATDWYGNTSWKKIPLTVP